MSRPGEHDVLVRCAREYATNLSDVCAERKRRAEEDDRLDAALTSWNDFDEKYGAFADEHSGL